MIWSEIPLRPSSKTLRQFAAAFLVAFLALGARQYFGRGHHPLGLVLAAAAVLVGVLGLSKPQSVRWLFISAMVMAFPIGWVVSQVLLAVLFYIVLTPAALWFRLRRRDLLSRHHPPQQASFWLPKQTPDDVSSYFRQY